jgi:hypothetical protein
MNGQNELTPAERALMARTLSAVKRWWLTPPGSPQEQPHAEQLIDAVQDLAREVDKR